MSSNLITKMTISCLNDEHVKWHWYSAAWHDVIHFTLVVDHYGFLIYWHVEIISFDFFFFFDEKHLNICKLNVTVIFVYYLNVIYLLIFEKKKTDLN